MTVRKGEPMDHLAATDEEFDALLDASSLGAPHVVAVTGDIPATARLRMAHAVNQPPRSYGMPDNTSNTPYPQPDSEVDSRPAAPTDAERAPQEVQPVRCGILRGATSTGKSAILAALFAYERPSFASRRQPLARLPWTDTSAADLLRSTLWPTGGFDEAVRAGRVQRGIHRGDGTLIFSRRQDTQPWLDMLDYALRSANGEAQAIPPFTDACRQVVQPLAPDIQTHTSPGLHTPGWAWAWRKQQRLRNLRHVIEPWVHPVQPLFSATPPGFLVRPAPVAYLHVARFTTWAYTAVDGGLLAPKTASAPHHRCRPRDGSRTDRDRKQLADAGRMTLRQTLVDGVHQLSAELPMLFHPEERESLALTSSLHTRLTYRVSDPYAVEARFRADDQGETVWTFARDLLRDGLEGRNGLGDVTVWPDAEKQERPRVFVRLSSPEGSALLSAEYADVRAFLEAGSNLVAYGAEHAHLLPALNALETTIGELARPGRCD
ncbi:SsgA family sporulation/cell division regulator [Streptomyces sp. NPDC052127]|uniref:SsgA family sporulation/cell division regulator n=1 Tax=Streptomyces sp. NPDC052127 TaxID=3155679 RepID=UPI0034435781